MNRWWGVTIGTPEAGTNNGQRLVAYEPRQGGKIEMEVLFKGAPVRYGGKIVVFDANRELTFECDWIPNQGWLRPTLLTIRLTACLGGTLVETAAPGVRARRRAWERRARSIRRGLGHDSARRVAQPCKHGVSARQVARKHDPFKALADPTRRGILELLLSRRTCTAGEIAGAFSHLSRPAVSRHLRVLRQVGLVKADGVGREQRYQLDVEPLARLQHDWFVQFTRLSEIALSALKEQVASVPGPSHTRRKRTRRKH